MNKVIADPKRPEKTVYASELAHTLEKDGRILTFVYTNSEGGKSLSILQPVFNKYVIGGSHFAFVRFDGKDISMLSSGNSLENSYQKLIKRITEDAEQDAIDVGYGKQEYFIFDNYRELFQFVSDNELNI